MPKLQQEEEQQEEDLYTRLKQLQRQLEFVDIQEEYIKDEMKNLKRELIRCVVLMCCERVLLSCECFQKGATKWRIGCGETAVIWATAKYRTMALMLGIGD